jgi:hypothetical protein
MCTSTHSGQETVDLNGVRSILSKFSFACSSPGCSSPAETVNVLKSHRTQDLGKVHKKYDNSIYIYIYIHVYVHVHVHVYVYVYVYVYTCMYMYIYIIIINYTYTLAHEHIPQTSNQATVRVQNYPSTASEVLSFEVLGASPLGDFQLARFWLPGVIKHGHLWSLGQNLSNSTSLLENSWEQHYFNNLESFNYTIPVFWTSSF